MLGEELREFAIMEVNRGWKSKMVERGKKLREEMVIIRGIK